MVKLLNRYIAVLSLCFLLFVPKMQALTVEQEQQFRYYWYAARQAITEERFADAYAYLAMCQAIEPNDPQTLLFMGILYDGTGHKDIAEGYYRQAYEADPHHHWYKYSHALMDKRTAADNEQAIVVLQHAYDVQSAAVKKGSIPYVEEDLLELLKSCRLYKSEWKKALALQDELDLQHGYDANSALTRARIYTNWRKPKRALVVLDKYLETDPTNVRFMVYRIEALQAMRTKPAVISQAYRDILAIDPYNLMVLNNFAYHIATHGGDLSEAEKMSAITIREEPDSPVYLDTYGWILHLQGKDDLAEFYLTRALWKAQNEEKALQAEIITHLNKVKKE